MAGKGGYQRPSGPRPPAGPGKASQRTDGNQQAVRVPNVGDSPDLQYGDRQRLEAAQNAAPLPNGTPTPAPGGPPPAAGLAGAPNTGEVLPNWLIDSPSGRPGEPVTTGLDMGAGDGSEALGFAGPPMDEREAVLEWVYTTYGNQEALAELQMIRQQRLATPPPAATPMM